MHLYSPADLTNLMDHMQITESTYHSPTKSVKITKTLLSCMMELRPSHKVILVGYLAKQRQVDTASVSSITQSSLSQTIPTILATLRNWDSCLTTKWPHTESKPVMYKLKAPWRSQSDIGIELGISQNSVSRYIDHYRKSLDNDSLVTLLDSVTKIYKHEGAEPSACATRSAEEWILRLKCR